MKANQKIVLSALVAGMVTLTGCGGGGGGASAAAVDTCIGSITASGIQYLGKDEYVMTGCLDDTLGAALTLDKNRIYAINGEVSVRNATLTIPAGTTLFGKTGASYLAIDQGAKISAIGTATEPIVFTAASDVDGTPLAVTSQGQWGGLSIFGKARTNKGLETYEAGAHTFGCDDVTVACNDADNSGTLAFVNIKYSGYEVEINKELNGLSLGGVGSGTTIHDISVIGSLDDGIEVWGGKVAMTNLYMYNNADDNLDWDHGWTGSATNIYIEQLNVDGTGSRGFETDNNGGNTTKEVAIPISNPTISNFTIITAAAGGQGIVHREGTAGQLSNGIIIANAANTKANIELRSANTVTNGLTYSGAMVLSHAASTHYKGHAQDLTDDILGNVSDAEAEDIVSNSDAVGTYGGATVTLDSASTDLHTLRLATPAAGADVEAMPAWTAL